MIPDTSEGEAFARTITEVENCLEAALSTDGDDLAAVAEECACRFDDWAAGQDDLAAEALFTQAHLYTAAYSFATDPNPLLGDIAEAKLRQLNGLTNELEITEEFAVRAAILYHMIDEARGLNPGGASMEF